MCGSENISNYRSAAGNIGTNSKAKVFNASVQHEENMLEDLDVRTERHICKKKGNAYFSDEDGDFVTPREMFEDSNISSGTRCSTKKKRLKLSRNIIFNENECNPVVELGESSLDVMQTKVQNKVCGVCFCSEYYLILN